MRHASRSLALLAAAALALVPALSAQGRPQTREGFWIGFGFGYGSLGCEGCGEREGAVSGYLKMGGTVGPHLLLGGETNGWTRNYSAGTLTVGNVSFTAYYYPTPASGFFLRGGVGLASFQLEGFDAETGLGLVVGGGYDIRVGTNISITPVVNFNWGSINGGGQDVIQVALGVTFH